MRLTIDRESSSDEMMRNEYRDVHEFGVCLFGALVIFFSYETQCQRCDILLETPQPSNNVTGMIARQLGVEQHRAAFRLVVIVIDRGPRDHLQHRT